MSAEGKPGPKWYHQPWVVVLLLFFVLGPFGLPLLYQSPAIRRPWKVGLTLLTLAGTVYLVLVTIKVGQEIVSFLSVP